MGLAEQEILDTYHEMDRETAGLGLSTEALTALTVALINKRATEQFTYELCWKLDEIRAILGN